jgi:hypothetical protein
VLRLAAGHLSPSLSPCRLGSLTQAGGFHIDHVHQPELSREAHHVVMDPKLSSVVTVDLRLPSCECISSQPSLELLDARGEPFCAQSYCLSSLHSPTLPSHNLAPCRLKSLLWVGRCRLRRLTHWQPDSLGVAAAPSSSLRHRSPRGMRYTNRELCASRELLVETRCVVVDDASVDSEVVGVSD